MYYIRRGDYFYKDTTKRDPYKTGTPKYRHVFTRDRLQATCFKTKVEALEALETVPGQLAEVHNSDEHLMATATTKVSNQPRVIHYFQDVNYNQVLTPTQLRAMVTQDIRNRCQTLAPSEVAAMLGLLYTDVQAINQRLPRAHYVYRQIGERLAKDQGVKLRIQTNAM